MEDLSYWLWLTLKKELPAQRITALLEHFDSPKAVFHADKQALSRVPGLKPAELSALEDKNLRRALGTIDICKKKSIRILALDNPHYPKLLASIYDPPCVLYVRCRERIDLNEHATIAMVGTRKATDKGRREAYSLAKALAEGGMTVVSGMAMGIDSAANEGALAGGGKTVAVLGCGVDICYPARNKKLMQDIINNGLLLSEFPPGTPPFPQNFPIRNRIISGLSLGTVVVEAPKRSGSLITARLAAEQNREVFTVPADVTRTRSHGSNSLLHEGVKAVLRAEDVLCEFKEQWGAVLEKHRHARVFAPDASAEGRQPKAKKESAVIHITLNDTERAVMQLLSDTPRHIDQLAEQGLSAAELSAALTTLEMKGLVRALPGRQYCLNV